MNFDASCLLPSGMTYEPPTAWNWSGPSDNACSYYPPPADPFNFYSAPQPRLPFFPDMGISPYSAASEVDYNTMNGRLNFLGSQTPGHCGNGVMPVKEEPQLDNSNDSAHGFVEPSRPRTGGSTCDRVHNDPAGPTQCLNGSSNGGTSLLEIGGGQYHMAKCSPSPAAAVASSSSLTDTGSTAARKKRDRFNGMTDEEVLKLTVPDQLCENLDVVIIGISPGMTAAYLGHHYAGPGNHFWKCLYLSGLIPEPMNACDDYRLKEIGIGFTNFVSRCSKGSVELTRREMKEGAEILTAKIQRYRPKIAVFNGKGIYEMFCNHKNFYIGKQPEPFPGTDTIVYVMPSSSARCSQLPRASDKVPFFVALRKLRDHVCGRLPRPLDESEVVFPDLDLKVEPRRDRRPPALPAAPTTAPELVDRKRHYPEEEDGSSVVPSTRSCDASVSSSLWQSNGPDLPNWSSYPSFNSSMSECAYGSRKFRDCPPPYGSCIPNTFGWNSGSTSRWGSTDYASHIRHPSSLDRSFMPDAGSGFIPRPGYGNLPPYPYATSSSGLRSGHSLLSDRAAMMNPPGVLEMLSPCNPLLRPYPQ